VGHGSAGPVGPDGPIKEMLYEPTHRHRYWFLDYRYLVRLGDDDHWVYSLCVIEGYSRKILAGMATEYQDTIAVLQLLSAALSEYGQPDGIVSDNGSVFTSDAYEGLLNDLGHPNQLRAVAQTAARVTALGDGLMLPAPARPGETKTEAVGWLA
jgi:hypothetical protein